MAMRRQRIIALAMGVAAVLAACGSDDDSDDAQGGDQSSATSSPSAAPAGGDAETFGPGCAAIPSDPANPGSFESMAQVPVATAASGNPVLSTLVSAVTQAGLVDSLNSAPNLTVFAPSNDAFAKIPQAQLTALLADKVQLTKVLTYHVLDQRLNPDRLPGTHDTLADGQQVSVQGSGGDFTVGTGSKVLCGNVQTANATVYIIDTVLMPPN